MVDVNIGFAVPTLVICFHRESVPKEKESSARDSSVGTSSSSRILQPTSKAPPAIPPVSISRAEPAEPLEAGEEEPNVDAPPVIPDVPVEPDWTSFDLGRCLRSLRGDNSPAVHARILQRLHLRWWHCSTTRMTALLRAAGVQKSI